VAGGFVNIQNLVGGNGDDSFVLASPSATLTSINGGAGNNSLRGSNASNNIWSITGVNVGAVSGIAFSNIQNITGGNNGNTYNFADGATLDGILNGGATINANIVNYSAYTSGIFVRMSATNDGVVDGINQYVNVGTIIANPANYNFLTLPNKGTNVLVLTAALNGYVNDPLYFYGFHTTTPTPSPTPNTPGFTIQDFQQFVYPIIEQPQITASQTYGGSANSLLYSNQLTIQEFDQSINAIGAEYDDMLWNKKITLNCMRGS
jgi:hypothetical protein